MKKLKAKIKFYKLLIIEITETLCTICLIMERDCHMSHDPRGAHMHSHFEQLKKMSEEMRGENSK